MINILIFGTGKTSRFVKNALNSSVKILAYVDNNRDKWYKYKNNLCIISPKELEQYSYDFIIIASQYNDDIYNQLLSLRVDKNKIFQYYKFLDYNWNNYKYNLECFLEKNTNSEVILTGISYALKGFNTKLCSKETYNLALGSQDIFYDYHTVKYLFEKFYHKTSKINWVIIGLSYYSFQYDMSLSSMKGRVNLYYDVLGERHNFDYVTDIDEGDVNSVIADKIFKKSENDVFEFNWNSTTLNQYDNKLELGKWQAEKDCDKNYPNTVSENQAIFREYITFLKNHNIKPIIVVFPASKYYTKYFSDRIENEFHTIINKFKAEFKFQYIDYFRSDLFNDDDFEDVSHLNSKGAEKFTKILNEVIEW